MSTHVNLETDWTTEHQTNLRYLNTGALVVSLLLVVYLSAHPHLQDPIYSLLPWLGLSLVVGASLLLPRDRNRLSAVLTLLGIWGAITAQYLWNGNQSIVLPLLSLPVMAAPLVLSRRYLLITAGLGSALAAAVIAYQPPPAAGLTLAVTWAAIASAAVFGHRLENSINGLVQWAVDSQLKNYTRAESFYQQREELRQALHDLNLAYNKIARMNDELDAARAEAERASEAKSVFLSNISHELRTPLNVVLGYTTFMTDMPDVYDGEQLPPQHRKDIELIQSNARYLLTLINDLLDLSKIEAGKLTINPSAVDLVDVFDGVIATSVGLIKEKPIQVIPDYTDTLPPIWADATRVRQILLNLMSNAIKYTDTGTVRLRATVEADNINIAVIDTGQGIPPETIERIFDRFEQIDQHSGIQGTGLGLDISQKLAALHDSQIEIESTVGKGSTFSLRLPLATPEQLAAEDQKAGDYSDDLGIAKIFDADPDADITWTSAYSVLLVEEEGDLRLRLHQAFEAQNCIVINVDRADSIPEMAAGLLPDVIILDADAAFVQASTVTAQLQTTAATQSIPIITLTSQPTTSAETDVDRVFTKPIEMNQLLEAVNRLVSNTQEVI